MKRFAFFVLSVALATDAYAQGSSSAAVAKAELLASSARLLSELQRSNARDVVQAVETARLARQQFERDQASRDVLLSALRRAAIADSLAVHRATALYAQRAITRQMFDNQVGSARADSLIRATESALYAQAVASRFRQMRDTLTARGSGAQYPNVTALQRRGDSLRADTVRVRAADQMQAAARAMLSTRASRIDLPATSLGMGLLCASDCATQITPDGRRVWTFNSYPVVGAVEPGSIADRLGLRSGDTLKTIDDISVTTRQGGERLSAIAPGRTIKLGWNRAGAAHTASVTLPERSLNDTPGAARLTQTVGNTSVQVFGNGASWTRDPQTGALRITGDSITVIVRPPGAARDTVRR